MYNFIVCTGLYALFRQDPRLRPTRRYMLDQWAQYISIALQQANPTQLAECFPADISNGNVAVLQNLLWQSDLEDLLSQFNPDWDWPALVLFSRHYLRWCYFVNPNDTSTAAPVMHRAFNALQTAYSQNNGYLLNDTLVNFVSTFGNELWLASPLLRVFNNIRSEREPITSKQEILLFVSTRLCRIYFTTNQISLCNTVFRSLERKPLEQYPPSQQVELKYAEGRYAMIKGELDTAFKHLQWSYNNCSPGPNRTRVFEQLVLPAILTGKMPTNLTLQSLGEINIEIQKSMTLLCVAIREIKFGAYFEALSTPWIKAHRFGDLVRSQMPILILRRAIKRLYENRGKPRALGIEDIRKAFKIAGFFISDENFLETESACIALIDSRTMFANLLPGQLPHETRLAMRPNNPIPVCSN